MSTRRTATGNTRHERQAVRLGWMGAAVGAVSTALFAGWAMTAPLASSAVAEGVFKTDLSRRVVQHQEGGIVHALHVRDGDHVTAGQVLVSLDDPTVRAEAAIVQSMLDSELAKLARLEAERTGARQFTASAVLAARHQEDAVRTVLERERRVFDARRQSLDAQLAMLAAQQSEVRAEITALETNAQASADAAAQMRSELDANERLRADGFVSEVRLTTLRRAHSEYRMKESASRADIAKARQKLSDLALRGKALSDAFAASADGEIKTVADRIEQLRAQVEPHADALRRQQIKAPVAGRVVAMRVNTTGAVLSPREPVLEIVPDDTPIVIEARLRTDAVGPVVRGSTATVRLSTHDQSDAKTLEGRVTYVSPDRQTERESGASFYVVQVEILDESYRQARLPVPLPGMPAEVFFRQGDRTALDFLVDPLLHRMQLAMRDK